MVNKIINAISNKLYELFGNECEVYSEAVEQNLQEPCFLINHIESRQEMIVKPRYYLRSSFDILFFSDADKKRVDCLSKGDILFDGLEYIKTSDQEVLRGINMGSEIIDDILHFKVDYNLILRKEDAIINNMEEISINLGGK